MSFYSKLGDYWNTVQDISHDLMQRVLHNPSSKQEVVKVITETKVVMFDEGRIFIRLAGLSGALAVVLAAYGTHVFRYKEADKELKEVFDTANKLHFLHSLALLAAPLTRHPNIVGICMLTGIIIFSGSCYYHSLTHLTTFRRITPYGGMCLIAGWLAMMF